MSIGEKVTLVVTTGLLLVSGGWNGTRSNFEVYLWGWLLALELLLLVSLNLLDESLCSSSCCCHRSFFPCLHSILVLCSIIVWRIDVWAIGPRRLTHAKKLGIPLLLLGGRLTIIFIRNIGLRGRIITLEHIDVVGWLMNCPDKALVVANNGTSPSRPLPILSLWLGGLYLDNVFELSYLCL